MFFKHEISLFSFVSSHPSEGCPGLKEVALRLICPIVVNILYLCFMLHTKQTNEQQHSKRRIERGV